MVIEKQSRHTCIYCGKKRFQDRLTSFTFVSWITPVAKSRVKHWACKDSKVIFQDSCMEALLKKDFNPVIMP